MRELLLGGGRALILVAHPDDETIWMGGTILINPQIKWTVFSLCRGDDLDRAPKFKKVCNVYGAKAIISNLEDEEQLNISESLPEIRRRVLRELPSRRFDYIFTHAYNGEYGHPRHKGVHRALKTLAEEKKLSASRFFCFNYELDDRNGRIEPKIKSSFINNLTQNILSRKKHIINEIYGFKKSSFEYRSCARQESFKELIL
ncbi:MAG: PIG-L family deacetylase [Candidatus Paceibacterota bacterium]|jgi:LmbE family N-acetylglucosaminyl deacetylase